MPFWGRVDHFKQAVESVLVQTDPDWTLTIVDDRYPDPEPIRWVAELGEPRIRYVVNDENLGVSRNFARCVGFMESEHGVVFGCDDVMLPGYVARVRELLRGHPGAEIVQPGVRVIDAEGRVRLPLPDRLKSLYRPRVLGARVLGGEELAASLLRANWTYFPALVWRVEELRRHGFDPGQHVVQDLMLLLDIVSAGGSMVLDDDVVFEYRRHASSVSSERAVDGSRFAEERALFAREADRFTGLGWRRAARAARRHSSSRLHALSQLPGALSRRDAAGARILFGHAVAH